MPVVFKRKKSQESQEEVLDMLGLGEEVTATEKTPFDGPKNIGDHVRVKTKILDFLVGYKVGDTGEVVTKWPPNPKSLRLYDHEQYAIVEVKLDTSGEAKLFQEDELERSS